jgi:hypothetical protein
MMNFLENGMRKVFLRGLALSILLASGLFGWAEELRMDKADKGKVADQIDKEMQASNTRQGEQDLTFPKGDGLRIVMIGNSWTRPAIRTLPEIAKAAGIREQHIRSFTQSSNAGHPDPLFHNESARKMLDPAIATGQWDVMTMLSRGGDKPEYFAQWMDLCLQANPGTVFYIQDGWSNYSLKTAASDPQADLARLGGLQAARQIEYKGYYDALNAKYPGKIHLIPCGAAVVEMVRLYYAKELSGFDCVAQHLGGKKGVYRDGSHVSDDSGMDYLLGYLYYGTLYRKSPELIKGFAPAKLDPAIDQIMRKVAWQAIIRSPLSGITDKNGDGAAD